MQPVRTESNKTASNSFQSNTAPFRAFRAFREFGAFGTSGFFSLLNAKGYDDAVDEWPSVESSGVVELSEDL